MYSRRVVRSLLRLQCLSGSASTFAASALRRERRTRIYFTAISAASVTAATAAGFWFYVRGNKAQCTAPGHRLKTRIEPGSIRSDLPTYTWKDIREHATKSTGIWVAFKNGVYDISEFVQNHPGGPKIALAAGSALEPFWELYSVHKTREVYDMLEEMRIGNVTEPPPLAGKKPNDEFANDPQRNAALIIISEKPFNAEPPPELLVGDFNTPNPLFFVRNHLPVPTVDVEQYRLSVVGPKGTQTFTLDELKAGFRHHTLSSTVQCSGNRRSEMSAVKSVKGLAWKTAAISNAEWTGVRLLDVLQHLGYKDEEAGVEHVQFEGLDKDTTGTFYGASIPAELAFNPRADILIAFEMNGEPLPQDHGFPVRVIVPGVVGARSVKWLDRIVLSSEESRSHWQRKDYKSFSPSVDWHNVDFEKSPAVNESPIQSAICDPPVGSSVSAAEGEVTLKGYAFSGGGRGVVRVDVSADGGASWYEAQLDNGGQRPSRAWAWTLWEVTVPIPKNHQGSMEVICKAVDLSHNVQPESPMGIWNLRGLLNNAWHRVHLNVKE